MKYSSAYLLQVAQNAKTKPPIPPQSPYQALMAVLDAGFVLKRHPSGRGVLVVDANGIAQPWPELPAQMERFLELNFLVVRREEAQVTECWCPDEVVKQELVALGWPMERFGPGRSWVSEWGILHLHRRVKGTQGRPFCLNSTCD